MSVKHNSTTCQRPNPKPPPLMHFCNGWVKDFPQRFERAAPTTSSRAKRSEDPGPIPRLHQRHTRQSIKPSPQTPESSPTTALTPKPKTAPPRCHPGRRPGTHPTSPPIRKAVALGVIPAPEPGSIPPALTGKFAQ